MASDISTGSILGDRYEILAEVGRGRSGIVYKASHLRLDKSLAVKVLFEAVGKNDTAIKRFEMEAKSASRLSHPNIINVLDFGLSQGGLPYLVMEFLDGADLQDVISTHARLSLLRACSAVLTAYR